MNGEKAKLNANVNVGITKHTDNIKDINQLPWYHGKITRAQTESLLQSMENGLFLIRDSSLHPRDFTLCVCIHGKIEYFHIYLDASGSLTIGDDRAFSSYRELIEFYRTDYEALDTKLTRGVPFNSSIPARTHSDNRWYHGKISSEKTDKLLAARLDGLFLIRDSSHHPGVYVLCVCYKGTIEQYHIKTLDRGLSIDEVVYFKSMYELIEHYKRDSNGIKTALTRPVLRDSNSGHAHHSPQTHTYENHDIPNTSATDKGRGIETMTMPWYHGKINREDAEHLLSSREEGLFLVRESRLHAGDYTLCVVGNGEVQHFHIECNENKLTLDEEHRFNNLVELVEYYKVNELQEMKYNFSITLKHCVVKQGAQEAVVNIKDFYNKGWALDKSELILSDVLGRGEFGEVFKATYKGQVVAVKQLKTATSLAIQAFLKEASVMASLQHDSLVQMVGVVLDESILLVTEFMSRGNLVDYLRSRGRTVISKENQLDFSIGVASGMAYLESKNVVHGDLAARNILLNDNNQAKISDFGLATQAESFHAGGKVSVKWAAPEVITERKFSTKSDVWSYGVLLWEIYSYGKNPYPKISLDQFPAYVLKGSRMQPPPECNPTVQKIMQSSWNHEASKRPSFKETHHMLKQLKLSIA